MAQILDGRLVAKKLKAHLRQRVEELRARGVIPTLVLVRVGEDAASGVYLRAKGKACKVVGIESRLVHFPEDVSGDTLRAEVRDLCGEAAVHGVVVQLPLPVHIDEDEIIATVDPAKDVDGFHPYNLGLLCLGSPRFVPATPLGILRILDYYDIDLDGRRVVVVGRSRIVGRPLANLLSAKRTPGNATVTVCHSRTRNLGDVTRGAEILIVAAGQKGLISAEMVSPEAVVIDVGMHREPDPDRPGKERLCGDVDFAALADRVRAITPVPGGVGPMTVACLLENTVVAAESGPPGPRHQE